MMDPIATNKDPFDSAEFPQAKPIVPVVTGYFITFRKGEENILRVNFEDTGAMQIVHSILGGIAKAQLVPAEIEQIRDLLADAIRSSEMGS